MTRRDSPRGSTRVFGWLLAISIVAWSGQSSAAKDMKFVLLAMVFAAIASEAVVSVINKVWDVVADRAQRLRPSQPNPTK